MSYSEFISTFAPFSKKGCFFSSKRRILMAEIIPIEPRTGNAV